MRKIFRKISVEQRRSNRRNIETFTVQISYEYIVCFARDILKFSMQSPVACDEGKNDFREYGMYVKGRECLYLPLPRHGTESSCTYLIIVDKRRKIKADGRAQGNSRGIRNRPEPFVSRKNSTQVRTGGHVHVQL